MRAWIAIACVAALVSAARADKERIGEARQHFQRGMTSYNLGEWDSAIAEFKIAYELSHAPGLLFNLAQGHRHKKEWELAAQLYRTYLELMPDAPNRAEAQKYLAGVEAERARAETIAPPPRDPAPPAPERSEVETRFTPSMDATPDLTMIETTPPTPPAPRRSHGRSLLIGGAVTVAAGVVVLAVGAYFAAQSASDADQIAALSRRGGAWTPGYAATYSEGQRDAPVGTALLASGGAIAAAGIAVAVVGAVRRSRARFAVTPTAGAWGLAVRCAF